MTDNENHGPVMPWQHPYVLNPLAERVAETGNPQLLHVLTDARDLMYEDMNKVHPMGVIHQPTEQRVTSNVTLPNIHW